MEAQNNETYREDEISLRELIEALLKEKVLIAIITVGVLILAALYTLVVLKPVYESETMVTIDLRENISTPYGTFRIPLRTMEEYRAIVNGPGAAELTLARWEGELTRENLTKRITLSGSEDQHFTIKATGGSPEEAYELLTVHLDSYREQMEMMLRRMAVDQFVHEKTTTVIAQEKSLAQIEEDLANTEMLMENKERVFHLENALISASDYALFYASIGEMDLSEIQGDKIITQTLNPTYLKLLDNMTELQIAYDQTTSRLNRTLSDLEALEQERAQLTQYASNRQQAFESTGNFEDFKNVITVINRPEIKVGKVAPRNALNLAIGGILGLMMGVFIAFFKYYWQNSN